MCSVSVNIFSSVGKKMFSLEATAGHLSIPRWIAMHEGNDYGFWEKFYCISSFSRDPSHEAFLYSEHFSPQRRILSPRESLCILHMPSEKFYILHIKLDYIPQHCKNRSVCTLSKNIAAIRCWLSLYGLKFTKCNYLPSRLFPIFFGTYVTK